MASSSKGTMCVAPWKSSARIATPPNKAQAKAIPRSAGNRMVLTMFGQSILAGNRLELAGVKGPHGFSADVSERDQLRQRTKNLSFVAAQDENTIASSCSPELD